MKNASLLKFPFKLVFIFLCTLVFFSCERAENITYAEIKDDIENREQDAQLSSLAQLVTQTEQLSLLTEAFIAGDIMDLLNQNGALTLFAPSNFAIEELFTLLGDEYNSFEDFDSLLEQQILTRILTYHMVQGEVLSTDFTAGEIETFYQGNAIEITASEGAFTIMDASEINAKPLVLDKKADNGVLHIIDKILIPQDVNEFLGTVNPLGTGQKTIKELIVENEEFTFLREALAITGLLDTLGEDGPFTVFAPNNNTLVGLLGLLGDEFSSLEDFASEEEISLLRDILLYHVLGEKLNSDDFVLGSLNTLSGSNTLQVISEQGNFALVDALFLEANFGVTDIPAKNGVIHTIDRILIPVSVTNAIENVVALAFERAMISTGDLNTALEFFRMVQNRMNLQALAEKEFTFFFPSDQAFLELFNQIGPDRVRNLSDEEGLELLKTILSYHCVENVALKAEDFTDQQLLDTFQGEQLNVSVAQDIFILDKTGETSKVIMADQEVLNGYIHVVDKILIPEEVVEELEL